MSGFKIVRNGDSASRVDERLDPSSPLYMGPDARPGEGGTVVVPGAVRKAYESAMNAVSGFMFGVKSDFSRGGTPYVSDPGTLGAALAGGPLLGRFGFTTARRAEKLSAKIAERRKALDVMTQLFAGRKTAAKVTTATEADKAAYGAARRVILPQIKKAKTAIGRDQVKLDALNKRLADPRTPPRVTAEAAAKKELADALAAANVELPKTWLERVGDWVVHHKAMSGTIGTAVATTAGASAYKAFRNSRTNAEKAANQLNSDKEHTAGWPARRTFAELAAAASDERLVTDEVRNILGYVQEEFAVQTRNAERAKVKDADLLRLPPEALTASNRVVRSGMVKGMLGTLAEGGTTNSWSDVLMRIADSDVGRRIRSRRNDELRQNAIVETGAAADSQLVRDYIQGVNKKANPIEVLTGVPLSPSDYRDLGDYMLQKYPDRWKSEVFGGEATQGPQ